MLCSSAQVYFGCVKYSKPPKHIPKTGLEAKFRIYHKRSDRPIYRPVGGSIEKGILSEEILNLERGTLG